jgi:hypothetical protein
VTSVFTGYPDVFEQLNSGKLRALAVASLSRIEPLPNVPTIAESGGLQGSIEGGPAEQIDRSVDRRHLVAPDTSDCLRLRENCARVPSTPSRRLR